MAVSKKVFTEEELKELGTPRTDLTLQAIAEGDLENAKKYAKQMRSDAKAMHDLYLEWVGSLLSFIVKQYGNEALNEALNECMELWCKVYLPAYENADPEQKLKMWAAAFRGHLRPVKIEEDEEKFTLMMQPCCGSGGKLMEENAYEQPPRNFAMVKGPCTLTFDRESLPVYCAHCPALDMAPIDLIGAPWIPIVPPPPEKMGKEVCRGLVYKEFGTEPEEFYERVGRKKGKVDWSGLKR